MEMLSRGGYATYYIRAVNTLGEKKSHTVADLGSHFGMVSSDDASVERERGGEMLLPKELG